MNTIYITASIPAREVETKRNGKYVVPAKDLPLVRTESGVWLMAPPAELDYRNAEAVGHWVISQADAQELCMGATNWSELQQHFQGTNATTQDGPGPFRPTT